MKLENLNPREALEFMHNNVPCVTPFKNLNHKVLEKALDELDQYKQKEKMKEFIKNEKEE